MAVRVPRPSLATPAEPRRPRGGSPRRARARILPVAAWPALALLALYVAFYGQLTLQLIAYPYDVDQGEGYDTWSAWLIDRGVLPYTDNQGPAYYSSNYPPVWSALVAVPLALTGPSIGMARTVST